MGLRGVDIVDNYFLEETGPAEYTVLDRRLRLLFIIRFCCYLSNKTVVLQNGDYDIMNTYIN